MLGTLTYITTKLYLDLEKGIFRDESFLNIEKKLIQDSSKYKGKFTEMVYWVGGSNPALKTIESLVGWQGMVRKKGGMLF